MPYPVAAARGGKTPERASTLGSGLVCYWPMSEAAGDRADLVNGYTLTDVGSVASTAGLVYSAAADFDMATDQGFTRARASAALVNFGPADAFTLAAWTYPTAFTGGPDSPEYYRNIINFNGASTFSGGYTIFTTANGQIFCGIGCTGGAANSFGWHVPAPMPVCTLNEWQLIIFAYDGPTGAALCRRNTDEATETNTNYDHFVAATAGNFNLGCKTDATIHIFDGRIGPAMIWGRVLTSAEMTELYNGGLGLSHPF